MGKIEQDTIDFIQRMMGNEITTEEKYLGMMELDRKFPNIGFYDSAQKFAHRWLKQKKTERLPYED